MAKGHKDLEIKTKSLYAELTKIKISEVATQTAPELKEISVKQEESKAHIKEKYEAIPCKYFHTIK